ncbi:L-type lectin-domain containing receptor kinase IX.1-like [Lolium perenne]|uniref:L-type lectin-domain containing receptor kinase IX.1-like n=1 Tax=Lolium perenne TaxID=4522 RepID=UPI003A99D737
MAAACSLRPLHLFLLYFFLYYSIWSLHFRLGTPLSFNFIFSQPGGQATGDFIFEGDAQFNSERKLIELTKSNLSENIGGSIGRVVYAQPVPLWDTVTGELTRFTATFSFQIKANSVISGDGFAFFLGHYPTTNIANNGGKNMGIFPEYPGAAGTVMIGDDRSVAIEFDTFLNDDIRDTSNSHMGINVNSIISQVYTNTTLPGRNLTSGLPMSCVISYDDAQVLSAVLQIGNATYHVNTSVDLRQRLPNLVAVGFSAATGRAVELHQILSWSFNSTVTLGESHTPTTKSYKKVMRKLLVEVTVTIGVILIVCIFVGVRRWQFCTRKKRYRTLAKGLEHFACHKLARAANNFAAANRLGEGGSACVYRGELANPPRLVAIKKFKPQHRQSFEAELSIVSRLRHRNLVDLIGWCYDSQRNLFEFICWWWDDRCTRLILVYELVPEGGLDQHLHGGKTWLPWFKRYEIIIGLGSAIQYLHVDCEQHAHCIVHGDLKSSNILLDSSYNAKLADFGCARLVHHETGSKTTDVIQGTYGYIDPVFMNTSQRNRESDVYSFGVVLLEMVSGCDPTIQNRAPLPSRVTELYHGNAIMAAADERLIGGEGECSSAHRQMERVLLIGLLCLHQDPSSRPSIAQAVAEPGKNRSLGEP